MKDGVDGQENILKFLQSVDIFAGIEDKVLLPVANNIKPKRFTYGQCILEAGKLPKGLYFIAKGCARVGLEIKGTDRQLRTDN